jgi:hypothetical protein
MLRRSGWSYYHRNAAQMAEQVADWMAALLGWPDEIRAAERERYRMMSGCRPATEGLIV